MSSGRRAKRAHLVTVVYCGGCNPHIDRAAVAAGLPQDDPGVRAGDKVAISGCPRACASGHELVSTESDGTTTVVVAGETVDGVATPAGQLAPAVARKLKE